MSAEQHEARYVADARRRWWRAYELGRTQPGPCPFRQPNELRHAWQCGRDEHDLDLADQKHNAQMLDGCETEDELNAELRWQSQ